MSFTELLIRRPVATLTLMIAMVFFGAIGYLNLPTARLPEVDFPTIQVSAQLPGANPETMASSVATPLEKQLATINGLKAMSSSSSLGQTNITVQFDLSRNIDAAAMDVQAAITKAGGDLPANMPSPPTFDKVNPTQWPIYYLAMYSETMPIYKVNDYAETFVSDAISTVPGVAQVQNYSQQWFSVRVKVNPNVLAARQMGVKEVKDAIVSQNVNLPLGTLNGNETTSTVKASGQLMKAKEYDPIIVDTVDGQPLRLGDLGEVKDGVLWDKIHSYYNGKECLVLAVKRQPGANTVEIVNGIERLLPAIRDTLPPSVHLDVVYDMSKSIREGLRDVQLTLVLAMGLVVLVVFFFLRSFSATLVSSIAIPLSLVFTFAVIYLFGYSLNTLTLLGLVLAVGFVVDDAIVVLENIVRHVQMGKKPFKAAVDGSREIVFTIISITVSLAIVFVPIMFMAGIYGRLLREFAVTITVAILVSGVIAICMSPMLSSRLLLPGSRLAESDPIFGAMLRVYRSTLSLAVRHRRLTLGISVLILGLTVHLFLLLPKGFLPPVDMNYLVGMFVGQQSVSPEAMRRKVLEVQSQLLQNPNVTDIISVSGVPLRNQGLCFVMLNEMPPRKDSALSVLQQLTPPANSLPGLLTFFQIPPMVEISTEMTPSPYTFIMQCPDTSVLFKYSELLKNAMYGIPEITGVNSDLYIQNPESYLDIDRDKARYYGITAEDIEETAFSSYADRQISNIYGTTATYKVILEAEDDLSTRPDDLANLYVKGSNGLPVRMDTFASVAPRSGPLTINHFGQLPSVTLSFDTATGYSLGQATDAVRRLASQMLPDSVIGKFGGTAEAFEESFRSIVILLIIALAIIYMILAILYESFIIPLTIISGLPSAAFGGLLTLWAFGLELNLYGFVGLFMLIGIVKKNAILVVDFALEAERHHKKSPQDAAVEGSLIRFRPIMMTTIAAIAGMTPIALGYGAGGESRQPLGLVVVGGLFVSQVVTLYLTPVVYSYLAGFQEWYQKRGSEKRRVRGIPEAL